MPLIDVKKQLEAKAQVTGMCKDTLPSNRKLPLWTDLQNPKLADVWLQGTNIFFDDGKSYGWNLKSKDEYLQLRRDWYQGNFFRTRAGHMVYLANAKAPDTNIVLGSKLFGQNEGKDFLRFHINRGNHKQLKGGGWAESFSTRMFLPTTEISQEKKNIYGVGRSGDYAFSSKENQNGIEFWNFWDLLQQLDTNTRISINTPIVITFDDGNIIALDKIVKEIQNFYAEYGTYITITLAAALTLVTAGSTAALVMNSAQKIFDGVKNLTDKIAKKQTVTPADIMSASGGLMPKDSEKYIQPALNASVYLDDPTNPQNLLKAANTLGVSNKEVVNIVQGFTGEKGANFASYLIDNVSQGKKVDDTMMMMAVLKAQNIVDTTALNAQTLEMAKTFINQKGGKDSAIIQNIATNSLGQVMNGVIPNINNVSAVVLDQYKKQMTQEEFRSWCNMASARNDLDTSLPGMSYQSMVQQAIECSNANKPYILPPEIPNKYRSCMSLQLTADTGIPVIDAKDIKPKQTTTTVTKKPVQPVVTQTKKRKRREYL